MAEKTIYAQTAKGNLVTLEADLFDSQAVYVALGQAGVAEEDRTGVMLSFTPFAELPAQQARQNDASTNEVPIWKPVSIISIPPSRWPIEDIYVDSPTPIALFVKVNNNYVSLSSLKSSPVGTLTPNFPEDCTIRYGRYWKRVYTEIIANGIGYTRAVTTTAGSSVTDAQTLSAELGVSFQGLSAQLSSSLEHSVTVMQETTATNTYNISAPAGKTAVFTIWQLIERYTIVDAAKNPVTYSGAYEIRLPLGKVRFPVDFPLNRLTNSADVFYADQTIF